MWSLAWTLWWPPALAFTSTFLVTSNSLALLDWTSPAWYARRSLYPAGQRRAMGASLWFHLIGNVARNLAVALVAGQLCFVARLCVFGPTDRAPELPSAYLVVPQLLACYACGNAWFFFAHWLVHRFPRVDRYVHATHHKFERTYALVGFYSSVSEMLLLNLPLALLGPLALLCHPAVSCAWISLVAVYVCLNHCGHQVVPRWLVDVSWHATHHLEPDKHFGDPLLERWCCPQRG